MIEVNLQISDTANITELLQILKKMQDSGEIKGYLREHEHSISSTDTQEAYDMIAQGITKFDQFVDIGFPIIHNHEPSLTDFLSQGRFR